MCREKFQIVSISTFDQRELKKIIYFGKNVSRVRESVRNALSRTVDTFLLKLLFFFHFDQKYSMKQSEIFPKSCISNNINFRLQYLQIGAFQQRYLKFKCETPYFEDESVPKTCKN